MFRDTCYISLLSSNATMPNTNPFANHLTGARLSSSDRRPRAGQSHVQGLSHPPLLSLTIPSLLRETTTRYSDRLAVVFQEQGIRRTWREFYADVDQCAVGFLALGLQKGDRVGIWSPNRYEWLLTQFATARIGLILVCINPAYRLSELEYALNKVEMKALVTAVQFKTSKYLDMLRELAPELQTARPGSLDSKRLPHLRLVIQMGESAEPGMMSFKELQNIAGPAQYQRLDALSSALNKDEPINIQFTSGTTGSPKGATLSHSNIVNNATHVAEAMCFSEKDILCIPVPLYHCFGMVLAVLACVSSGAAMVFPSEAFDPLLTLQAVSSEKCTALHGVPTMFIAELGHPRFGEFDLSSLRTGIMAGAPCPIETMRRVVGEMQMKEVTIAYGMTETSPVSFQSNVDDPIEKRVSTVGRIIPHLEVKIVDENGEIVPIGQKGELCTKGYSVMQGYWKDEARTAEALRDGWMHTGDLAVLDEDGFCNIVGRVKDMVIRGGENVYPREVEEFLYKHPKIQEVQVFGIPDQKYGEELCAWVILKSGTQASAEEIKTFCQGQIAHYKIPRHISFRKELPMTVTGKAQKFLMRETMIKELGISEIKTA